MKKVLIISILTILAVGFVYSVFDSFQIETAKADSGDNVSGYAWSENIGWISFNNTSGGGGTSYGVNIDPATGDLSGYAWSENIGWIDFAPAGPYPEAPNYSARLDIASNKVTGWARALANGGGWDGWIKMAGIASDSSSYGVSRSGGGLTGYAWGSDVVGWVKFKGIAQNNSPYGAATTFYENQSPSVINLQVTQPNYCVSGPAATFSWSFSDSDSGDTQSAYQAQADNNSDFSSPEVDSNKVSSASNAYASGNGKLAYNATYYWRVKVWDNYDLASSWMNGSDFTTPKHAYPTVSFKWTPANPSAEDIVRFTDLSQAFGGANLNLWSWDIPDVKTWLYGGNSTWPNPEVKFNTAGAKLIQLTVVDSDNYSCSSSNTITANLPLPGWREVAP